MFIEPAHIMYVYMRTVSSDDGSDIQYVFISDIHCLRTCPYNRHRVYRVYCDSYPV